MAKAELINTLDAKSVFIAPDESRVEAGRGAIQQEVERIIEAFITSLPDPKQLSAEKRRGIISRYTAVLEGNFIYWMTGAYLAVASEDARSIILENLHEEVRDSHPAMLRRFAVAARSVPTDSDAADITPDLTNVRLFVGLLSGVHTVLMLAFFEGLIQRFMPFLAELAALQGSTEMEYTDVHGVCDIAHTEGLFCALVSEMVFNPSRYEADLFEGVSLLHTLIRTIIDPVNAQNQQAACALIS